MKAGKLQRENSLLRFLVCHVIVKVHTYISRWRLVCGKHTHQGAVLQKNVCISFASH